MTVKHVIFIFLFAAIIFAVIKFYPDNEIKQPPGILVKNPPISKPLVKGKKWTKDDFNFTALRSLKMEARVLGKESYWADSGSELSPYDLAVGWGPLSNQTVVDGIEFWQARRWLHWKFKKATSFNREVELHTANMHIIPASDEVEDILDDVQTGNVVSLSGYLVSIKRDDGWRWKSSTRWDDTGGGACEVVWLENIHILR
ncbi:MAG: hypothetical protein GXO87_02030 [Chlorobi bacterium]|nr:hypothetical protein [Chlorobiota bacterium]